RSTRRPAPSASRSSTGSPRGPLPRRAPPGTLTINQGDPMPSPTTETAEAAKGTGPSAAAPLVPARVMPPGSIGLPSGPSTSPRAVDVAGQLADSAPTFGNLLRSIGDGVASSQSALDKGVIDTVKTLNDAKITLVTDVIEQLDDDGLPDPSQTKLQTAT